MSGRVSGTRKTTAQALTWPRTGAKYVDGRVIAESVVPRAVISAQIQAASRELLSPGSLLPDYDPTARGRCSDGGRHRNWKNGILH